MAPRRPRTPTPPVVGFSSERRTIGNTFPVVTTCVGDCDVFVSVLPAYNSGFRTGEPATAAANRTGPPSTRVQAGPILANPPKPRIANPKKVTE